MSITDSGSNSYLQAASIPNAFYAEIYYCLSVVGGSSFQVSGKVSSSATNQVISALELSGVIAIDQAGTKSGTSGSQTVGPVTTVSSPEIAVVQFG